MRNTLAFAAAATLALIGVGWYLGWYSVKTTKNVDGTHNVNISIDDHKVEKDVEKGIKKGEKFANEVEEKNRANQDPASSSPFDPSKVNSIQPPKVEIPRLEMPRHPFRQPDPNAVEPPTTTTEPPIFELPPVPLPTGR